MKLLQVYGLLLFVLFGTVLQSDGGVLKGLKGLKKLGEGLPYLASAGLIGAMKLALVSKAALALGGLGTALGAAALARTKKKEDVKKVYHYNIKSSGPSHGYDKNDKGDDLDFVNSRLQKSRSPKYKKDFEGFNIFIDQYDSGLDKDFIMSHSFESDEYMDSYSHESSWRKKRSASMTGFDVDMALESAKKADPLRCTERLVCEISAKSATFPRSLAEDEAAILNMIKKVSVPGKGKAYFLLKSAMKHGLVGSQCEKMYYSCQYSATQIMKIIRSISKKVNINQSRNIKA